MKRVAIRLVTWAGSCLLLQSCTTAVVAGEPDEADAGPPTPIEAGIQDVGTSDASVTDADASRPDAGKPKPLAVSCSSEPCYVAVSGNGSRHLCGLLQNGTVRCWGRDSMNPVTTVDGNVVPGDNALGRGGVVTLVEAATPAPVAGLSNVTQISVGPNLGTCARTSDGAVFCWGRNEFGQLGRPRAEARLLTPTRVEGLPPVDEVQLGAATACAIASADRSLYCWGKWMNGIGVDAGLNPGGSTTFAPQLVSTIRPPVQAVSVATGDPELPSGGDTLVALLDDGSLATIGRHPASDTTGLPSPTIPLVMPGITRAGAFAFVEAEGRVTSWHYESLYGGVYVFFTLQQHNLPVGTAIVDVKQGAVSPLAQGGALLATGRLFRWGPNTTGSLGVAPAIMARASNPQEITGLGGQVVSFAMAVDSTCASLVNGEIKCWGANGYGELGRGTVDWVPHPEAEVIR